MPKRRRQRRRAVPPLWLWAATILFALAGPAAYLVWDTKLLWYVAPLSVIPLYLLIDEHSGQSRKEREERQHFNTGDAGPWTPPDGL
jgi:hypothetical protein